MGEENPIFNVVSVFVNFIKQVWDVNENQNLPQDGPRIVPCRTQIIPTYPVS